MSDERNLTPVPKETTVIEETDTILFPEKEIRCQGHDKKIPNFLFIDCPCCEGILEFNAEYKNGLWIYWSCSKCDLYWHVDGEPIVQDGIRNGLRPVVRKPNMELPVIRGTEAVAVRRIDDEDDGGPL